MNEAKNYLNQVRQLNKKIECIESDIEALRVEQITLSGVRMDGMPHGSGVGDPTAQKAIALIDKLAGMESYLIEMKSRYWQKRMEVIETIGKVSDADLNELLYLRYVQLESFEGIAYKMNYSYRHTLRLHGRALDEVGKLIC